MGKLKGYYIYLEEDRVERALELIKQYGGKKSGLLNGLLKKWIIKEEKRIEEEE